MTATLDDWIGAAELSVGEVATTALSFARVERASADSPEPGSLFGAYVPLVATGCQVQVGVVAELQACRALARSLFGMDPDAEFEADGDVADALGEIANMVAGCMKSHMNERAPGLNTGLPLCVAGHVEPGAGAEHASLWLRLDDVCASVRVLLSSTGDPASARLRIQPRGAGKS